MLCEGSSSNMTIPEENDYGLSTGTDVLLVAAILVDMKLRRNAFAVKEPEESANEQGFEDLEEPIPEAIPAEQEFGEHDDESSQQEEEPTSEAIPTEQVAAAFSVCKKRRRQLTATDEMKKSKRNSRKRLRLGPVHVFNLIWSDTPNGSVVEHNFSNNDGCPQNFQAVVPASAEGIVTKREVEKNSPGNSTRQVQSPTIAKAPYTVRLDEVVETVMELPESANDQAAASQADRRSEKIALRREKGRHFRLAYLHVNNNKYVVIRWSELTSTYPFLQTIGAHYIDVKKDHATIASQAYFSAATEDRLTKLDFINNFKTAALMLGEIIYTFNEKLVSEKFPEWNRKQLHFFSAPFLNQFTDLDCYLVMLSLEKIQLWGNSTALPPSLEWLADDHDSGNSSKCSDSTLSDDSAGPSSKCYDSTLWETSAASSSDGKCPRTSEFPEESVASSSDDEYPTVGDDFQPADGKTINEKD